MPKALFCFRFHKKSGNESNIESTWPRGRRGGFWWGCLHVLQSQKTLPTGDLDLLAIAQNLASARTFCKLEYCLNEKFTPYCLDKSPIYPRSRDVSSLFFNHREVPELEILTILPDLTLNFVTLIGRPQCNGRYCWQASLFHLPPKFTSTVKKYGNGNGVRELY